MSPLPKPTTLAAKKWLKIAKAAQLLGLDARTIKRWMKNPAKGEALGAVRHGRQRRIPLPESEELWESEVRFRLNKIGVHLKPLWQIEIEELGRQNNRWMLEANRLWLAAHWRLLARPEPVNKEDIEAILLLWQAAGEILGPLPRGTNVDDLKAQFPARLRARNFSDERVKFIMSYWPDERSFREVRAAYTWKQLEEIRRKMDVAQAAKTCNHLGKDPTANNLRPYLHKDIVEHINDTREALPSDAIKAPKPEDLRRIIEADALHQMHSGSPRRITESRDEQGRTYAKIEAGGAPTFVDARKPQKRISLRTFRERHPLKKSPQREILAAVFDVRDSNPGVEEKPDIAHRPRTRRNTT